MAVKFEFTLDDVDASNLISILQDEKVRAMAKSQEFINPHVGDWYDRHAAYLEGLKQKVLAGNTRAE